MFREVTRKKQALTREECVAVLSEVTRGVLAVQGDDGYPYAVPTNHYYDPESGCLFFHSGKRGHKIDALDRCSKVSYCVMDEGARKDGDWAKSYRSVVVFGRMEAVSDYDRAMDITRQLSLQFTDDRDFIEHEIKHFGGDTLVLALIPAHITGKTVREA